MDYKQARKVAARDALARSDGSTNDGIPPIMAMHYEEFTNPVAPDPNGIKTSIASAASIQTYTGADLNGAIGAAVMSPPRTMTITTTAHTDIDAVIVVITGTDIDGAAQTDSITLTNGGNATDAGVECFAYVTSIVVPAQTGTGGALEFGFGDIIGLAKSPKVLAGEPAIILEIEAGAVVATGTFATPTAAGPHGSYDPATATDASNDYALIYLLDAI